jgi:hypothetical protein
MDKKLPLSTSAAVAIIKTAEMEAQNSFIDST